MPSFNDHLNHALENIAFVEKVSSDYTTELRWKITAAYYAAYHLIQSYLAQEGNLHPDSHEKLKALVSPHGVVISVRLSANIYTSYSELEILSRKARYKSNILIGEDHFCEAVEYLDEIIDFYKSKYPASKIPHLNVYCNDGTKCKTHKHIAVLEKVS